MRFKDRNAENAQMIETLCLILSFGAIFLQIWILMSAMESYLSGEYKHLGASVIMSFLALLCCGLTAWTTTLSFVRKKRQND